MPRTLTRSYHRIANHHHNYHTDNGATCPTKQTDHSTSLDWSKARWPSKKTSNTTNHLHHHKAVFRLNGGTDGDHSHHDGSTIETHEDDHHHHLHHNHGHSLQEPELHSVTSSNNESDEEQEQRTYRQQMEEDLKQAATRRGRILELQLMEEIAARNRSME